MKQQRKWHFLIYLALLSIIGFLATDMYLPAFDVMRTDLNTSKSNIGASLTIFLAGFAIAQLIWGPVSDKFGNRTSILIGLSIFAVASVGIFFTHSIVILLALRLFQAIGGCAAAVSWQSIVIDTYSKEETNKIFASIMPLVALSPALAPLLGAYISLHVGWRYIFITISIIAAFLILYTFTLHKKIKKSTSHKRISYLHFFNYKNYLGNVIIYGFCSAGFFAWLTGAPFFLKDLGYNESAIGLSFVPQTIAFIIGGYGYRLISEKTDGKKILPWLLLTYSVALISLLLIATRSNPTLTTLLIPFCFMAFANGATYPIVVAEALKPFSDNSGKASALQNTLQLSACFLASAGVSVFSKNVLLTTSVIMALTIVFVALGFWMTRKPLQSN